MFNRPSDAEVEAANYLRRRIVEHTELAESFATSTDANLHLELAQEYRERLKTLLDAGRPADLAQG